ncbi:hypothetical protein [Paenibacillus sinensis]|nr:hypothetical protein [Paenibacillus sinensis]
MKRKFSRLVVVTRHFSYGCYFFRCHNRLKDNGIVMDFFMGVVTFRLSL